MKNKPIWCLIVFLFLVSGCPQESPLVNPDIDEHGPVDYLSFETFRELENVLDELNAASLSERKSIAKLSNFHSMFDDFEDIQKLPDAEACRAALEANSAFIQTSTIELEGEERTIVNMKVSPLFACIVNANGMIRVEGVVYNVLENEDATVIFKMLTGMNNRNYFPDFLGAQLLPFGPGITQCPIAYPVIHYMTAVNGRTTIVQLWKGYGYPWGFGAEVGIYTPGPFFPWLQWWFPDYLHRTNISFKLWLGNELVFNAPQELTWWRNDWGINLGLMLRLTGTINAELCCVAINGHRFKLEYTIVGHAGSWSRVWDAYSSTYR